MLLNCDTLHDTTDKISVTNKTQDVNLSVFSIITRVNDRKTLENIYHANINVCIMVKIVTQIRSG